ncbi:hypothetical protein Vadar_025448 [Vaccinium darrowii]|uniref:Uncharacterized protein n=1 Tax=Vaccinium darrowii TaxID=229202 RepID=A0ACB7Y8R2_9ERIC|nr:hypothetical protein Vadar_025448 [Vaccinium darrowii]
MSDHIAQLHEENAQYKSQVAHMQNTIDELMKNQASNTTTTEGTTEGRQTTPIVSPSGNHYPNSDCKLLHWTGTGEVVAEGRWSSSDPNERVHHIPLRPSAMRVWVDVAKNGAAFLWRPTSDMETIEDAVGTTVAWLADKVLVDSTPRLISILLLCFCICLVWNATLAVAVNFICVSAFYCYLLAGVVSRFSAVLLLPCICGVNADFIRGLDWIDFCY